MSLDEILDEIVVEIRNARRTRWTLKTERTGVPGRHHDHHRLGFLGRDQVVHDEARAANRGPRIVRIARAVEQVKDRILLRAGLVAGRRVDVHAAELAEAFRIVRDARDGAVRHVLGFHEIGAGNIHHAPGVAVRFADRRAARVHHRNAVDIEVVAIGARIDRPDRDLPNRRSRPSSYRCCRAMPKMSVLNSATS